MEHDPIKAKIIELVPDLKLKGCTKHWNDLPHDGCVTCNGTIYKDITLADVLRAINSQFISVSSSGGNFLFQRMNGGRGEFGSMDWFYTDKEGNRCVWNLTTDYDGQTQEVKEFIGKLLGV